MTGLYHLSSAELKILYDKKRRLGMNHKEALESVRADVEYLNKVYATVKIDKKNKTLMSDSNTFPEAFNRLVNQRSRFKE